MKETIRQNNFNEAQGRSEVIAAIRNIQNKDDVFAVLTRSNKDMNKKGIKVSASGGDIVLNGVKIDYNEFAAMNKNDATSFLSNLSSYVEPTPVDRASTQLIVSDLFKNVSISDIESITNITMKLLSFCSGDIKTKIIGALASLIASLAQPFLKGLDEIFPNHSKYAQLLEMVVSFFARKAEALEEQYKTWIKTDDDRYFSPVFRNIDVKQIRRAVQFFELVVDMYCKGTKYLTEIALKELIEFFYKWLAQKVYEYQQDKERATSRRNHSALSPSGKINCTKCGGHYYKPINYIALS